MAAALLVVLAGFGIGVVGMVVPDLYVVGLLVIIIGGIGVLVRLVDWFRVLGE